MKRPATATHEEKTPAAVERRRKKATTAAASSGELSAAQGQLRLAESAGQFRRMLKAWYQKYARVLPWRGIRNPYATWLSEIMLQQTRVATVIDRYSEFLLRFPTLEALAAAPEADVLALWSGLGYYRRARMLHRGAQFVVRELDGVLPRTVPELRTLPGVGLYTSAAIASIAFGESVAVVDGNVERVLLRIMGLAEEKGAAAQARVQGAAQALVPPSARENAGTNPPGDHNQAMMELGATLCLPRAPLCLQCPVFSLCLTRGEHSRLARGKQQSRTVAHLLTLRKAGTTTEVLLERRSAEASLMPGMLELPPLPLDAIVDREPVLRVRHAITNTNYYVQVFSESAAAVRRSANDAWEHADAEEEQERSLMLESAAARVRLRPEPGGALMRELPASQQSLVWMPAKRLHDVPLTGLARKILQRLGVMTLPPVKGLAQIHRILPSGD
jgi:A/G-specific adenine glycosylase